jgi:SAM-dependent methyltransferase
MKTQRLSGAFSERKGKAVLSKEYWNTWYHISNTGPGKSAWGKPTSVMLEGIQKAVGDLKGKRIADLGAGDGRYSVHFAEQGAHVDHVDYSKTAVMCLFALSMGKIASLEQNGRTVYVFERGGRITLFEMDAGIYSRSMDREGLPSIDDIESKPRDPKYFDLIFSSGLAEYLTPDELRGMIGHWQNATAVGGAHAIIYLAQGPGVSYIPGEHPHEPGFIESLYDGWNMTFRADDTRPDKHVIIGFDEPEYALINKQPTEHFHRIRRFIAVKPE